MKDLILNTFVKVSSELEIQSPTENSNPDEKEILLAIRNRVKEMLENAPDLLMSYLYRLDVLEYKINECLDPNSEVHPYDCIASLIWNRQKLRMKTKMNYSKDVEIDDEWKW